VSSGDASTRPAILSLDTTADIERMQIEAWRRMTPLEKVGVVRDMAVAAETLAFAGIRLRHPGASDRECFIRFASLKLGPALTCRVYADAHTFLGSSA
jgi:hypothetical protein